MMENLVTGCCILLVLRILFAGEINRAFASTTRNDRSSRSHTIFRINIESRLKRQKDVNDRDGFSWNESALDEEEGDGPVRISTFLNLVDLAGSESVRHQILFKSLDTPLSCNTSSSWLLKLIPR